VPEPELALRQAFELIDLASSELERPDTVRERDERRARAAWDDLRRRLGWRASVPERR
jgi:hypothetical protein